MLITTLRTGIYATEKGKTIELPLGECDVEKTQAESLIDRKFAVKGAKKSKAHDKSDKVVEALKVELDGVKSELGKANSEVEVLKEQLVKMNEALAKTELELIEALKEKPKPGRDKN